MAAAGHRRSVHRATPPAARVTEPNADVSSSSGGAVDFSFAGGHLTLLPGAFVIVGIALVAAAIVVLPIKKLVARYRDPNRT